ncbi:MAG: hypothetical protein JW849_01635, partial [Phycisphaerae bacterium]|nr:hypothetical protein [Phycisphaerae bacterium]
MPAEVTAKDRLQGRTLWVPRMTYVGARLFSAVFRSIGIDARPCPESDHRTLELGGLYTSGEECYPGKITIGDFLRVMEDDDFDPKRTAFFMPTAEGPCRFGQYAPYLEQVLRERGCAEIPVVSPTSKDGYDGFGAAMVRSLWRGLIAGDILRKMLLKTRPYETQPGAADAAFERGIERVEEVLMDPSLGASARMSELIEALKDVREYFHAVPARYVKHKPLIGVVGEIFCRLNT